MSAIGAQQNIVGSSLLRLRVDAGGIGGVARHTANGGIDRLHAMRHEDLLADKDGRLAMNSTSMSGSGFVRQRELGAFEGAPLFGDVAARASVSAMNEILARNLSKVLKEKSQCTGPIHVLPDDVAESFSSRIYTQKWLLLSGRILHATACGPTRGLLPCPSGVDPHPLRHAHRRLSSASTPMRSHGDSAMVLDELAALDPAQRRDVAEELRKERKLGRG